MNDENKIGKILADYGRAWQAQEDQREAAIEDRRFKNVAGSMWEDSIGRQFANRPRFEMDKISREINRLIGEYRANRISVDFRPDSGASSDKMAEIMNGMYLSDERRSNGQEAYNNAFTEGLEGGMGCWRLTTKYEDNGDPENEMQDIYMEPVFSACSMVIWDPDAVKYDKSDAVKCWLLHEYTPEAFKDKYPDCEISSFPGAPINNYSARFNWFRKDVVYVAEYYEKRQENKTIVTFKHPITEEKQHYYQDEISEAIDEMLELGFEQLGQRKIKKDVVYKCLLTGSKILEEEERIAGCEIPIVPFYAYRTYIDGKEFYHGEVRKMKDRQRLINMQVSALAEISATSPKEKLILDPKAVQRHLSAWSRSNIDNKPFLLLDSTDAQGKAIDAPIKGQTTPPQVPQTTAALMQFITDDINQEMPVSDPKVASNVSGVAIQKAQQRSDMSTFILMDNMAKSMRRCGEIWRGMAREVYSMPRTSRIVNPDGSTKTVTMMETVMDNETGMPVFLNNISQGKYEVVTDVGPSFTTRRDAMLDTLTNVIQFTPDTNPIYPFMMSGIIENLSGPGLDDVKDINKLLKLQMKMQYGLAEPQDEDEQKYMQLIMQQQQQQAQHPDPMALAAQAEMQKAVAAQQEAQVKAEKNQIDLYKAQTTFQTNQGKNQIEAAKAGVTIQNVQADTFGKQLDNAQRMAQNLRG